jgi:hypothetical protein
MNAIHLVKLIPPPAEIGRRIELCRQELAELKKLLRISRSAHRAAQARAERLSADRREVPGGR